MNNFSSGWNMITSSIENLMKLIFVNVLVTVEVDEWRWLYGVLLLGSSEKVIDIFVINETFGTTSTGVERIQQININK